jgi:hypothetical protein
VIQTSQTRQSTKSGLSQALAASLGSAFVLLSTIRWLFTGKKPTVVFYAQAYQRWKHMAKSNPHSRYPDGIVIDAEVREIPQQPFQINKKDNHTL